MSERNNHKFQFSASQIARAAQAEAEYHEQRIEHWREREQAALARVEATIGASVTKHEVTGGTAYGLNATVGDREAWTELQLAERKIRSHQDAADRYRTDHRVYSTQDDRAYELDTDDVHHFRLGGQPRED